MHYQADKSSAKHFSSLSAEQYVRRWYRWYHVWQWNWHSTYWILEIVERTQLMPKLQRRTKELSNSNEYFIKVDLPPSRAPGASALRAKRHSPAESKALILANWNRETMRPNAWTGFLRFKLWTCNMTVQNAKPLRSRVSRLFQAKNPKLQSSPVFSIKVHCSLGDYIWLQPSSNRSF